MPHKQKAVAEENIRVVKKCLAGRMSRSEAAHLFQVDESTIKRWIHQYESEGSSAFLPHECYAKEHGYIVARIYADEGVTRKRSDKRAYKIHI